MPPRKRAALAAGVSEGTLAAFRYVKESGDEKLIAAMLADELPISAAHRQIKMQVEGTPATGKTSTGSAKADKTLVDLKTAMSVIKNLPTLSDQIGELIPKAAGRAKKADRERLVKLLTSAKAFIGTARKDDPLGALESAIQTAEAGIV